MNPAASIFAPLLLILPLCASTAALARAPDPAATEAVITRCEAIYHESGHPCACPFDRAKNGLCGARSAHDRPGGASPVCFANEVTPELLADLRAGGAVMRERCRYHFR